MMTIFKVKELLVKLVVRHRRRKRGGGQGEGGQPPANNLKGGANIPLAPPPPNNPPTCTGKTIPLNSILEFSIISDFKMRNVIIWHWFIKNLVGTQCHVPAGNLPPPPLAPPPPPKKKKKF